MMRETFLEAAILDYLTLRRIPAWRTHSARFPPVTPGVSDIIGILPGGRFLAVECKAPGGSCSSAQSAFIGTVRNAGGVAVLAYDLVDVVKLLS